jgi:4-hydroxybenzoate polyprenyltransferase
MNSFLTFFGDAGWASDTCFFNSSFFTALAASFVFVGMIVGGLLLILLSTSYLLMRIVAKIKHSNTSGIKKINKIFRIAGFVSILILYACIIFCGCILFAGFLPPECWK